MRNKRGFVLASTLIMMVFVLSISSVMVVVLGKHNRSLNAFKTIHQNKQIALQISTDFVEFDKQSFVELYQSLKYSVVQKEPEIVLENHAQNIKITIKSYAEKQALEVALQPEGLVLSKVETSQNGILLWQIYGGDK
jgi:hypothetical protein